MKTVYAIIALVSFLCYNSFAPPALGILGPVTLNITGTSQNLYYNQISAKTNAVGTKTNFTLVSKSTTTNFSANNQWLLALLENSFHTNFPAGSQLLADGPDGFIVADSTGTNFFFTSPVIAESAPVVVYSGVETYTSTNSSGDFAASGSDTELYTFTPVITYDDSSMTNTTDHTHTRFSWTVFDVSKYSRNITNGFVTYNTTMKVIGSGSVRGQPPAIFNGTIHGKSSGIEF